MPTRFKLGTSELGLAVALLVAGAGAARAVPVAAFGSFGFIPFGTIGVSGGGSSDINAGTTSITLPGTEVVNSIQSTYLNHATNLTLSPYENVGLSSQTLRVPVGISALNFVVTVGSYVFDLTSEKTESLHAVSGSTGGNVSLLLNGTFADNSGALAPGSADMSVSLTQTAPGATINASFSLDTPESLVVPEPMSIAVLGTALLGLATFRRVRRG